MMIVSPACPQVLLLLSLKFIPPERVKTIPVEGIPLTVLYLNNCRKGR